MTMKLPVQGELNRRIEAGACRLREIIEGRPKPTMMIVLGSGFKGFETRLSDSLSVSFDDLPAFPVPSVAGHGAQLVFGTLAGRSVVVATGRVHLYEGYPAEAVAHPIRVMQKLGIQKVLLTNASGSLRSTIRPGQIVVVDDQINMTGTSCLGDSALGYGGTVFCDMGAAFDPDWCRYLLDLPSVSNRGVYVGVLGPSYETPAETRMLAQLGGDVVGMSTVQEVLAARQLGMTTCCLSFVTNMAGGLGGALCHSEVLSLVVEHRVQLSETLEAAVAFCGAKT